MRIVNDFDNGNEGIGQGVGGTLNIRKILRIPATKVAASAANDGAKTLNYTANLELNIPVTPQFAYGAVEISQMTLTRLIASPKLRAASRRARSVGDRERAAKLYAEAKAAEYRRELPWSADESFAKFYRDGTLHPERRA